MTDSTIENQNLTQNYVVSEREYLLYTQQQPNSYKNISVFKFFKLLSKIDLK